MVRANNSNPLIILSMLLLAMCLGCRVQESSPTPTATEVRSITEALQASPTTPPTETPTATPARVVLLATNEVDPGLFQEVEESLRSLLIASGIALDTRQTLTQSELSSDIVLTVALPPAPDLTNLVQAAPESQFLAIGIPGLTPGPNLSVIGPEGSRPDQQGFIAGYLAAVVTEDWRVGVISAGDTPAGRSARGGFINGVRFFCGLCQPIFPPFEGYPLFVEVTSTASRSEWQAAADILIAAAVQTIYIDPGIQDKALYAYLAETGVKLIGGEPPPQEGLQNNWIASIHSQPAIAMEAFWEAFERGERGMNFSIPISLEEVNPNQLSPGRQKLINEVIDELILGIIDTGINPQTGDPR